jgi:glycyl-tRNA synthetase
MKLPLYSADDQEEGKKVANSEKTMGEALEAKIVKNETLGYYLARSFMFLTQVGIKPEAIRFRQHRSTEMAHYANDCWDAEVETSYGWIEVAGHSDRSAFDLQRHQAKTKIELMAARPLKNPITVTHTHALLNKQVLGKEFKKDQSLVVAHFDDLDNEGKKKLSDDFAANNNELKLTIQGKEFTLTDKHISFKDEAKT